jgi:diguanylate cyclase (GGDEF)-like protein
MATNHIEHPSLTGELPSPKGVALAIIELCRSEDSTCAQISHLAQTDPALTGRLIRQANSAACAGVRPVASVSEAILRLGMNTVRNLALSFSLVDQYKEGPCEAFDYQGFWSHSLLMALAAKRFCTMKGAGSGDELFACGLLARIGCLGLATIYPAEYSQLLSLQAGEARLVELEQQHLQTDHNELTTTLLSEWGMPEALVLPILHHEQPDKSPFAPDSRRYELMQLFHLAKRVADLGLSAESERSDRTAELLLLGGRMGLDADQLGSTIDELVASWHEWGEVLRIPSSSLPCFAQMSEVHSRPPQDIKTAAGLRVLIVDDDPTMRSMLEGVLGDVLGHSVISASDGQTALAIALERTPQVVITDWMMPGMDGPALCQALRATEWGQTMYVVMLTSIEDEEEIVQAFEAGVDDFLVKPINIRQLRARLRAAWHYVQLLESWERDRAQLKQFAAELAISNRRMAHAAMTDQLTSLPNRRSGMDRLANAWASSTRHKAPLSALLIDIDHFKQINDKYGHAAGDSALREVAQAIQRATRKDESVCRMGGEEFLVICANADIRSGLVAAERIRKLIADLPIDIGSDSIRTTVSIGIACREEGMKDAEAMVNAADVALYKAKEEGRNRCCVFLQGKLRPIP